MQSLQEMSGAVARVPSRKRKADRRVNPDSSSLNEKRQRVSQACHYCHSRKEKCDGLHPACTTCVALKQTCVYSASARRRGLPAGYVHVLETVLGLVISKFAGSDDVVGTLLRRPSDDGNHNWLTVIGTGGENADALREIWRHSEASGLIQRFLTHRKGVGEEEPLTEAPRDQISEPERSTMPLIWVDAPPPSRHSPMEVEHDGPSYSGDQNVHGDTTPFPARDTGNYQLPSTTPCRPASEAIVLPSNCWHLLDLYFTFTHCWFPILEKHDIYRVAYASSGKTLLVNDLDSRSGEHAALWALLAYTSIQEKSKGLEKPPDNVSADVVSPDNEKLYQQARSLIPSEDSEFGLGHIQALLLLAFYKLGYGSKVTAWLLVNNAVRFALALGIDNNNNIDLDPSGDKIQQKKSTKGRSHHVLLGCFVLENMISAAIGRVPYLTCQSIHRVGLLQEDGLEEWEPWASPIDHQPQFHAKPSDSDRPPVHIFSTFNQLVNLSCILNDLLYALQNNTYDNRLHASYEARVTDWYNRLPEHCQFSLKDISNFVQRPSLLPNTWNLQLMHISIVAMLQLRGLPLQIAHVPSAMTMEARKSTISSAIMIINLLKQYHTVYPSSIPSTCVYFVQLARTLTSYGTSEDVTRFQLENQGLLLQMATAWPGITSNDQISLPNFHDDKHEFSIPPVVCSGMGELEGARDQGGSFLNLRHHYNQDSYNLGHNNIDIPMAQEGIVPSIPTPPAKRRAPESQYMSSSTQVASDGQSTPKEGSTARDWSATDYSVFDQLASLDNTECVDTHPQFFQNLGFGLDDISSDISSLYNFLDLPEIDAMRSTRP